MFGSCGTQVHLRQLFKSIFSVVFLGYVSHCSALTHMFLQACNTLHRASSSLSALTHFTGWVTKSSLTGRGFSCSFVSVCVEPPSDWDVHTVQKSRDTQEPLQYDRLPLFVQAAEGLHMLPVCLRVLSCCSCR